MKASEILREAKKRIEDPKDWWDGTQAVGTADKDCALTAIPLGPGQKALDYLLDAASRLYGRDPIGVNDTIGHFAVMECYSYAIKLAETDEE